MKKQDEVEDKKFNTDEKKEYKKGKGGNRRRKPKDSKPTSGKEGNVNDTGYYYTDPNILASVTNFSFTEFLGLPVEYGSIYNAPVREKVANVVAIRMNPSVQPTAAAGATGYEAINVVGLRNYTNLTAGNGKTDKYAPSDPILAVLAIGSAVSMYSHIKRAFNSYQLVNQRNRDYPKLLFKAMGIDWDDFKSNIANYRDQFNLLVCQFDKIPMFDSITYLEKCKHMYEYIYVDEQSPLAQTYLFTPNSVWTLDEAYDPNGSGLVTTYLYNSVTSEGTKYMSELLDIFALQIQRLTSSSTLSLVYSDILRLIQNGKGKSFLLETIPLMPDPKFAPIINDEIRHWLNNMIIVGAPIAKDALPAAVTRGTTNENDVASDGDTGAVIYRPTFKLAQHATGELDNSGVLVSKMLKSDLVNFDSMAPSIDDKVAALRLAVRGTVSSVSDASNVVSYSQDLDLGDFYAVCLQVWSSNDSWDVSAASNNLFVQSDTVESVMTAFAKQADELAKLKYAPRFKLLDARETSAQASKDLLLGMTGDLTYYTMIPHELTKRIKDAEMFGLFDFRLG